MSSLEILTTFDSAHIPTLDIAVQAALERFANESLPPLSLPYERPLVLGSGNAIVAAQIIFAESQAIFGDESSYEDLLRTPERFDSIIVMSASGGKHAVAMCKQAQVTGLPVHLITNNQVSLAATFVPIDNVHVYPKNREPYTYNTSTYLGPILAYTKEPIEDIKTYITSQVEPRLLRNFGDYSAFTFLLPLRFKHLRAMLSTKFDELFGPYVNGRFFTAEEIKHAKTVVTSGDELFISFGCNNTTYGLAKNRLEIPLSSDINYGTLMTATYFVVGKIQAAHPPYFAMAIASYAETASKLFGQTITPIVE